MPGQGEPYKDVASVGRPARTEPLTATFGNGFRVEQEFTGTEGRIHSALARVSGSIRDERTRLYDSIDDVITEFWRTGKRDRPWLLTVITDGQDNESHKYPPSDRNSPARIGQFIGQKFNREPSNFVFVIGVGEGNQIDKEALGAMGDNGGFLAMAIGGFPLLERIFLRIALQVTGVTVGRQITVGNHTWAEVARVRQVSQTPFDYAFLIDRSGSMSEPG